MNRRTFLSGLTLGVCIRRFFELPTVVRRYVVRFTAFATLLGLPLASAAQTGEAEWYQCKVASDCTLIANFCGYPHGVNKEHRAPALEREQALKLGLALNPGYSCATFDSDPWPGVKVTCLNNWCALSWPDRQPPRILKY